MNSEILNSGKVGLTVFKNLASQREAIVENWSASGLLRGKDLERNPFQKNEHCPAFGKPGRTNVE